MVHLKCAYSAPGQDNIELTDTGVRLDGYKIPAFDKVTELVKGQHLNLPFHYASMKKVLLFYWSGIHLLN